MHPGLCFAASQHPTASPESKFATPQSRGSAPRCQIGRPRAHRCLKYYSDTDWIKHCTVNDHDREDTVRLSNEEKNFFCLYQTIYGQDCRNLQQSKHDWHVCTNNRPVVNIKNHKSFSDLKLMLYMT